MRTLRHKYGAAYRVLSALTREYVVRAERLRGVEQIAEADRDIRASFAQLLGRTRLARAPRIATTFPDEGERKEPWPR